MVRIVRGVEGARAASGVVVVVDVLRAFTTTAYAFEAGLSEIALVATVEEALAVPGFRMGEVGGRLIPGFDHDNSPSRLVGRQLAGSGVLRTSSGTQCVVAATGASEVWLGSLVVASATVRAVAGHQEVTLVASGPPEGAEEDLACAQWMASLIQGTPCSQDSVVTAVRTSRAAARHHADDPDFPPEDIDCAVAIDAFDFAMKVERRTGHTVAKQFVP